MHEPPSSSTNPTSQKRSRRSTDQTSTTNRAPRLRPHPQVTSHELQAAPSHGKPNEPNELNELNELNEPKESPRAADRRVALYLDLASRGHLDEVVAVGVPQDDGSRIAGAVAWGDALDAETK